MKIHLPLTLVCAVAFTTVQAQAVHSVSMGFGANGIGQSALLRSDVFQLIPLDPESLADYTLDSREVQQETFSFGVSIGLLPFRKEVRRGPELRLGFIHAGWNERQANLRRTVRTPYDTLVSVATGEQFLLDSVRGSAYYIVTKAERIGLDASLVWSTTARWSLYGGVGVMGGPSINARTYVEIEQYEGVAAAGGHYASYPQGASRNSEKETIKGGTGWWCAAYVPLGLDFTLSREHAFWKQMHLYYEMRPQLVVQGSPELDNTIGTGLMANFGIRLSL